MGKMIYYGARCTFSCVVLSVFLRCWLIKGPFIVYMCMCEGESLLFFFIKNSMKNGSKFIVIREFNDKNRGKKFQNE